MALLSPSGGTRGPARGVCARSCRLRRCGSTTLTESRSRTVRCCQIAGVGAIGSAATMWQRGSILKLEYVRVRATLLVDYWIFVDKQKKGVKSLQIKEKRDKISVVDGRIVCPICHTKTGQEIRKSTTAKNLPVYCRQCKNQTLVNIENGQCSLSSPC